MTFEELRDTLAVDVSNMHFDPDDRIERPEDLLALCPSLRVFSEQKRPIQYWDTRRDRIKTERCVMLAHFPVQEFLDERGSRGIPQFDAQTTYEDMIMTYIATLMASTTSDYSHVNEICDRIPFLGCLAECLKQLIKLVRGSERWIQPMIKMLRFYEPHTLH